MQHMYIDYIPQSIADYIHVYGVIAVKKAPQGVPLLVVQTFFF